MVWGDVRRRGVLVRGRGFALLWGGCDVGEIFSVCRGVKGGGVNWGRGKGIFEGGEKGGKG